VKLPLIKAVIGHTVGDPLKGISGTVINSLIKVLNKRRRRADENYAGN
jgi:hypothetical protein